MPLKQFFQRRANCLEARKSFSSFMPTVLIPEKVFLTPAIFVGTRKSFSDARDFWEEAIRGETTMKAIAFHDPLRGNRYGAIASSLLT